jgi:hypothetical protein
MLEPVHQTRARGRRLALAELLVGLVLLAVSACRREPPASAPAPAAARADSQPHGPTSARPRSHSVARLPIGTDGAIIAVGVRYDSRVEVSGLVAKPLTLAFPPAAVDEFVDATAKMVAARRSAKSTRLTRTVIDDPDGGALSFSRRGGGKSAVFRFYFSDAFGTGFPITVTASETRAVLNALRTGAAASRRLDKLAETPSGPPPKGTRPEKRATKSTPKDTAKPKAPQGKPKADSTATAPAPKPPRVG